MDTRKTLATQLKELRKQADLTQGKLAENVGMHQTEVSLFERTGEGLSLDKIEKLFRFFGYVIQVAPVAMDGGGNSGMPLHRHIESAKKKEDDNAQPVKMYVFEGSSNQIARVMESLPKSSTYTQPAIAEPDRPKTAIVETEQADSALDDLTEAIDHVNGEFAKKNPQYKTKMQERVAFLRKVLRFLAEVPTAIHEGMVEGHLEAARQPGSEIIPGYRPWDRELQPASTAKDNHCNQNPEETCLQQT